MKFIMRKCDLALMREVIALGDRLKALPEATPEIVENIERLQVVLRRLPEATPNVDASFGFNVLKLEPEFVGINRGWHVYQETIDGKPAISITSLFTIVPDRDEQFERAQEHYHTFHVGRRPLGLPRNYTEWIEEVRDPDRWRNPDQDFEVEADFRIIPVDDEPAARIDVVEHPNGFTVAIPDVKPVRVGLRPWRFVVHEPDRDSEIVLCDGKRLGEAVAYAIAQPAKITRVVNRATREGIMRAVAKQRRRLLRRVPRDVVAVQRAVPRQARRVRCLAMDPAVYEQPFVVRDVLRYRAAAIALGYCQEGPDYDRPDFWREAAHDVNRGASLAGKLPENLRTDSRDVATYISAMLNWRALFSPSGETYGSLDRTLMNLPAKVPAELVLYLRAVRLPRPITDTVRLLALLTMVRRLCRYGSLDIARPGAGRSLAQILLQATETEVRASVRRVARQIGRGLNPECSWDMDFFTAYLLDWPEEHHGRLGGLVGKAIRWHQAQLPPRRVIAMLGLGETQATLTPPIPLPAIDGIRFLRTVGEIADEGESMQHCVSFHAEAAVHGGLYLFHIEYAGEHATIEITGHAYVTQASGPRNTHNRAVEWGRRQIEEWARGLATARHAGQRADGADEATEGDRGEQEP